MEMKQIRALAQILEQADLSVLDISEGDLKIHMERQHAASVLSNPVFSSPLSSPASSVPASPVAENTVDYNNMKEVKSPMVGVFYAAPSPDKEPFVSIGSKVKKGDVLCIIEAMKLMNEITAEMDGEIIDICAENGQIVEYGQTIFKIL